jgi:uncharacterized protein (DUF58 family)
MVLQQVFMLVGAVFMVMAALATNAPNLHYMAAVTVAVPIVAYVACRLGLRDIECARRVPKRAFEGSEFTILLQLRNRSRLPKFSLRILDALPEWLVSDSSPSFAARTVWPGWPVEFSYQARAEKRGVFRLGPAMALASDPLGLFQAEKALQDQAELVVYPTPVRLDAAPRAGGSAFGTVEAERPAATGRGFEFATIRDYQPGDEQKRIHWKSTARLGRLAVVEYDQALARDVAICLDARAGTDLGQGKKTTLEFAVKAAASLANFAAKNGSSASLAFSDSGGWRLIRASKAEELFDVYEALARVRADGAEPISAVLRRMEPQLSAGALVVAATSDLDEGLVGVAAQWAARRVRLCLLLLDPEAFAGDGDLHRKSMAFASRLSRARAAVQILGPDDDLAGALRKVCDAAV